jgi:hypothetical protein
MESVPFIVEVTFATIMFRRTSRNARVCVKPARINAKRIIAAAV